MKVILPCLFLLIFINPAGAQVKCVFDRDGNCTAKGRMKTHSQKTSFGSKYEISIRIDKWEFFSTGGDKVCEGSYREKDNASFKDGEWLYYSTDQQLLFKRMYDMGTVVSTQFLDTGCYYQDNDSVCITSDTAGTLTIVEKKGKLKYTYTSTLNLDLRGDPYSVSKNYSSQMAKRVILASADSEVLLRYPATRATLNIKGWDARSPLNLAGNGDFEASSKDVGDHHASQVSPGSDKLAKYWASANETPDFYKTDSNCYGGFRVMGTNFEVLRNQLKQPLTAGKTYCLQFKIKLRKENSFTINGVSVICSKEPRAFRNSREGLDYGVVLQSNPEIVLACREKWMQFSGKFEAEGGEKYLYFSNFSDPDTLFQYRLDSGAGYYADEVYYYIDDVVLLEESDNYKCPCNARYCALSFDIPEDTSAPTGVVRLPADNQVYRNPQVGQTITLRNIQFETNKAILMEESDADLDSLVDLMLRFPNMKVEISGHTDNKGNKKNNQELSFNRANAVMMYLLDRGIDEERITTIGYGQDRPVDTNDTEAGRFNNRRVEFKILEL